MLSCTSKHDRRCALRCAEETIRRFSDRRERLFFSSIQLSKSIAALPSQVLLPPLNSSRPALSTRLGSDAYRSLLVTGLTSAYLGLLVGREFIDVQDHEEFLSSQSPQPRIASGLSVVQSAGHLNAAHNASAGTRHVLLENLPKLAAHKNVVIGFGFEHGNPLNGWFRRTRPANAGGLQGHAVSLRTRNSLLPQSLVQRG